MRLLMMLFALSIATPAYAAEGGIDAQSPALEIPAETIRPRPERPAPRVDFDTRYMAPARLANPAVGEENAKLSLVTYGARF